MFKVLITGAQGQVGRELVKLVPDDFEVIGLSSADLDITDNEQVLKVVQQYKPGLIINASAYTAVDKAESDSERAFAVNSLGVEYLAQAAAILNIPLFHISTDYVFPGTSQIAYKEDDSVGATGVYGASKLAGEKALSESGTAHIILRTSWVFATDGNNFVKTMLRLGKERDTLGVVADQYGCPTSASSIAIILWRLATKYVNDGVLSSGVYHFTNSPACTWYDFAGEIFKQAVDLRVVSKSPVVNAITTADYPTPARRPIWSVMDCTKIETLLDTPIPSWRDELTAVLKELQS